MNLHEQLGALEMGVDQLIQAVVATQAENIPETPEHAAASQASEAAADAAHAETTVAEHDAPAPESSVTDAAPTAPQLQPTLEVGRPTRDEITMKIGDQMVSFHPDQISKLIEELSNARASMQPEQPMGVPPGWQFVSTKNPVMAVQKQSNGDRLLVMRHTGHGWVPFTFSPDVVIQMYMMLSNA
ncbi:hypothetical protein [Paraburkholderia sp. ZP32-5]|uniref:hypothetical protein n=1 Tax=Paraburkholderia sp. ZP32-5 TaxID=2883245 RepID=UPI001F27A114|nr:hypothetical protein [Paraburkholderia sp. ZP32-5]